MFKNNILYVLIIICAALLSSGCGMTSAHTQASVEEALPIGQRLQQACAEQVFARETAVRDSNSAAQFMALASQAERCLEGIRFYPNHPDNQVAMRLNALAVVNFVKSGDLTQAKSTFSAFTQRFAQQDLVFADYTSFIDTATALLEPNLSSRQLAMLNINSTLRSELQRKRQWSLN